MSAAAAGGTNVPGKSMRRGDGGVVSGPKDTEKAVTSYFRGGLVILRYVHHIYCSTIEALRVAFFCFFCAFL